MIKNGALSSIPESGGSPGDPVQYSYLENSMDRGAWQSTVLWSRKESDITERLNDKTRMIQRDGCAQ